MEQLLVCDALDERDFLKKKINSAISQAEFVAVKRIQDSKINGRTPVEEFEQNAKSTLQSIKDMIDRYRRLDIAITLSNATTEIKTKSGKVMTVAAAIALRKALVEGGRNNADFTGHLLDKLEKQYNTAVTTLKRTNDIADAQAEKFKEGFVSKDSNKKISEEDAESLTKLTKGLYGEMIDPIKIEDEMNSLDEEYGLLLKELETAIKVSNATTTIEY